MKFEAKEIAGLALIGTGTAVITYKVLSYLENRKKHLSKKEKIRLKKIADVYMPKDRTEYIKLEYHGDNNINSEKEGLDDGKDLNEFEDPHIPMDWKGDPVEEVVVPDDGKPSMAELIEKVQVDTEKGEELDAYLPQNTEYMTERVEFDEDGVPLFKTEAWDSEDENVYLISRADYEHVWQNYEKTMAVWFEKSGVMVDEGLKPIEVIDTVGPTAFTSLCRDPDSTIYVRNDELETDYELSMNRTATIEEAWADQQEG